MFAYNSISGKVPDTPADDNFSWVSSSEKKVHEETEKACYRLLVFVNACAFRSTENMPVSTMPCCWSSP